MRLDPETMPQWDKRVLSHWGRGNWRGSIKAIYQRRLAGKTLESIAADYGLSKQRISQLITKIERILVEELGAKCRKQPRQQKPKPLMSREEAGALGGSQNTPAQMLARANNLKVNLIVLPPWRPLSNVLEHHEEIYKKRLQGLSYDEIGAEYDLTPRSVGFICRTIAKRLK